MPVVTMLNQKGGVGKTSTCHHLAGTLAQMGRRVLLVDNDPQASLTQGFFGPAATRSLPAEKTIASVYRGDLPFPDQILRDMELNGVATPFLLDDGTVSDAYDTLGKGMHAGLPGHSFVLIDAEGQPTAERVTTVGNHTGVTSGVGP